VDEMIVEGSTGLSCEIDRESFLAAAKRALADPEKLDFMGRAAAIHVRKYLKHESQVRDTMMLYKTMASPQ
jgi:hypothetical protein